MLDKARKMFKIDMQKLRTADSSHLFWMDLTMLFIVLINLLYLLFGFLFQFHAFQVSMGHLSINFKNWYALTVFPRVFHYDLIFVGIYVAELIFRWIRSIYRKKYDRWWFYPLVHWYDVIMCIPIVNGLNFFGVVRLFGLVYRLQRIGVFDLTKTYIYKQSSFVSEVVVEEVADRVIAKMISMAQNEVLKGSPLMTEITINVIKPKEEIIVNYLSNRISTAINTSYSKNRTDLKHYVEKIVGEAILENDTVDKFRYIPGLGKVFQETLDRAVGDITFNTIDKLMQDIVDVNNKRGIKEVTHSVIESFLDKNHPENDELNKMVVEIINESLEEVKKSVLEKEWKIDRKKEKKLELEKKILGDKNI